MALTATLNALKDTELDEAYPTTNYGTYGYLAQSEYPDSAYHTILGFDVSQFAGKKIVTATLQLYYWNQYDNNDMPVEAWECTRKDWVEAEATWQIYKTGSNWTTPGGDKTGSALDIETLVGGAYGWKSWDITTLIQKVKEYDDATASIILVSTNEVGYKYFYSKEYPDDPTLRPKLVITYIEKPAVSTSNPSNPNWNKIQGNGNITSIGGENCTKRGFLTAKQVQPVTKGQITGLSWCHGLVYYSNYLYASARASPGKVAKISASTLAIVGSLLTPQHGGVDATTLQDIIAAGGYIWTIDDGGWVYKISTAMSVVATYHPTSYSVGGLTTDGTYVYGCGGISGAYEDIFSIKISTGAVLAANRNLGYPHSIVRSGSYCYVNDITGKKLHKIQNSDLALIASYDLGYQCSDDINQDGTYIWLASEETKDANGTPLAGRIIRVTISTGSVSYSEPFGLGRSYGIFGITATRYVLLDYQRKISWLFASNLTVKNIGRIQNLDSSEPLNELAQDGTYLYLSHWEATNTHFVKVKIADAVFDNLGGNVKYESGSYGTGTFALTCQYFLSGGYDMIAGAKNSCDYGFGSWIPFGLIYTSDSLKLGDTKSLFSGEYSKSGFDTIKLVDVMNQLIGDYDKTGFDSLIFGDVYSSLDKEAAAPAPERTRKQRLTGFQSVTIQGRRTFHLNRRIW